MNRVLYLNQKIRAKWMAVFTILLAAAVWSTPLKAQGLFVDMGGDRTICRGTSVTLTPFVFGGIPPYVFNWSTGATTSSITVSPASTATYSVTVTDNGGIQGVSVSRSVTVFVETPFQMSCNDHIQVSLDEECAAVLEPDMLLEGSLSRLGGYTIEVFTIPGNNKHPNEFDATDIGQTFQFQVFNICGNSCWGQVSIEDKLPPELTCRHDSLRCNDPLGPYERGFPFPRFATIVKQLDTQKFLVANWDACTDVELSYQDSLAQYTCDNEFTKRLYRRWYAVDASGNFAICYDTFSIYKPDMELDVDFPPSYDGYEEDPIQCDMIQGYPTPDLTGRPVMASCMTLQATYTDTRIDVCGATYKILRKWTILDWCSSQIIDRFQVIKVIDDKPPVVVCPPNFTVSTDVYSCSGSTFVPAPEVLKECSDWDYEVYYKLADPNGKPTQAGSTPAVRYPDGRYYLPDLPLGRTWIIYRITDDCGNWTECASEVDIVDDIPPIPVCDEHTVVSLTLDGTGKIFANTFSDLSYDNCGIDYFEVRRMDSACVVPTDVFGPYVFFCCEDIGTSHMVEFRVWDLHNNHNSCMVEVTVQDKLPPTIVCPPNITISCRFDFYLDELDIFGSVVTAIDKREPIIIQDTFYKASGGYVGLDGYAIDACDVTVTESETIDLQCGQGTILRTFRAEDRFGSTRSCTQRIELRDPTPFSRRDITWPKNVTIDGCLDLDTKPSKTGAPTYMNERCAQVAASYKDLVLTVVDSACYKILRTWTVLDWCQYDPSDKIGIWTYEQIIKVQNTSAPVLEVCSDTVFCDNNAIEVNGVCLGYAELIQNATDDCTPVDQLEWRFRIDAFNDGIWDTVGYTNDARGRYPVGVHKIQWIVSDQCDNESSCTYLFEIRDCKPPTPYCLHGITTVVMPSTGCITIWASDFDAGSFDNCTDPDDLVFSFSLDSTETSRTWCCDSMFTGNILTRAVQIYVWDEYGNKDFCETYIVIRDNDNVCPDSLVGSVLITGAIENRSDNDGLRNAVVNVNEANVGLQMKQATTTSDGRFTVDKLPMYMDYTVFPEKDDDLLNGVSTADLIQIQRHILGISTFSDPMDLLAGDINRSGHISAKDLTELRKAILGLNQRFPNNKSWRFIPEGYVFQDPTQPWDCDEDIILYQVENDQWSKNFTGIKVGDVNKSARSGLSGGLSPRSITGRYFLETTDQSFRKGDQLKIPVTASEVEAILGLQMTLVLDPGLFRLQQVESGAIEIGDEHIGMEWMQEGLITVSWNDVHPISLDEEPVLFTLVVQALRDGQLSGNMSVSSAITQALAVMPDETEGALELRIKGGGVHTDGGYYLHQNRPNPFEARTAISFDLPEAADVSLTIFDVTGKVLYRIDRELPQGTHTEWIDRGMLTGAGIYYYQLDVEGYTATRKMILVE